MRFSFSPSPAPRIDPDFDYQRATILGQRQHAARLVAASIAAARAATAAAVGTSPDNPIVIDDDDVEEKMDSTDDDGDDDDPASFAEFLRGYNNRRDMDEGVWTELKTNGVAVIRVIDDEHILGWRKNLYNACYSFPYLNDKVMHDTPPVLDSRGLLANPGSFHCTQVRHLRKVMHIQAVNTLWRNYVLDYCQGFQLEQIACQLMSRKTGTSPPREPWQRSGMNTDDKLFSSFLNLDLDDTTLDVVKGSHLHSHPRKISHPDDIAHYEDAVHSVTVPPGCMIIYSNNLVKREPRYFASYVSFRLYGGWRLSPPNNTDTLVEGVNAKLDAQAVMPTMDGHLPSMYSPVHWAIHRDILQDFSTMVNPKCISLRRVNSGSRRGVGHNIIDEKMKSLEEYQLVKYPDYAVDEKAILHPRDSWVIGPFLNEAEEEVYATLRL